MFCCCFTLTKPNFLIGGRKILGNHGPLGMTTSKMLQCYSVQEFQLCSIGREVTLNICVGNIATIMRH